jgi:hypothetical protein
MNPSAGESQVDRQLRLLVLAHYALAVITALKAILGLPLLFPGLSLMDVESQGPAAPPPGWFVSFLEWLAGVLNNRDLRELAHESVAVGVLLVFTAAIIILLSLVHGIALAYVGRCIARRKARLTVVIFSWLDIIYFPFGSVLSIFAIRILGQSDVREQFGKGKG